MKSLKAVVKLILVAVVVGVGVVGFNAVSSVEGKEEVQVVEETPKEVVASEVQEKDKEPIVSPEYRSVQAWQISMIKLLNDDETQKVKTFYADDEYEYLYHIVWNANQSANYLQKIYEDESEREQLQKLAVLTDVDYGDDEEKLKEIVSEIHSIIDPDEDGVLMTISSNN